jgi:glycolate oxidase
MGTDALLAELREALGREAVLIDPDSTQSYSRDMMPLAPSGRPLAVVLPADLEGTRPPCAPAPGRRCRSCRAAPAVGCPVRRTITGEHGVGKIKRDWLEREIGPVGMRVHRQFKKALDPDSVFNPGSMVAL